MAFYYGTGGSSGTYTPPPPPAPITATWLVPPTQGYQNPFTTTGASAPSTTTTRPPIDFSHLDFSNDPILARIKALGQEQIAQSEAEALAARKKLVIGYGDPNLANKLGLKDKVGKKAGENPFSILAELKRTYERRNVFDINRPLSDQANLFYSTERGRELALSGEQDLRDRARAEAAVQEQAAAISNQLIAAKMAVQAQKIAAQQAAYERAIQQAMYAAGV